MPTMLVRALQPGPLWRLIALVIFVASPLPVQSAEITLQYDDSIAKDVFVYEFLASQNMDDFQFGPTNFGKLLATVNTGSESSHNIRSLLQFDLSGQGLFYSGQVQSASLKLRVIDAKSVGFPVANSSATDPVQVDVFSVSAPWTENLVTWLTQPGTTGGSITSTTVNGINQTVNFNVTTAVQGWVVSPAANYGLQLTQLTEVRNGEGQAVGAVFASSKFGSNLPALVIQLTPESPGDANFDGLVDGADYTIWADNFLQSPRVFAQGDFSHDSIVDGADYTIWADHFDPGGGSAFASAVPEPATAVLSVAGLPVLVLVAFRRRRERLE